MKIISLFVLVLVVSMIPNTFGVTASTPPKENQVNISLPKIAVTNLQVENPTPKTGENISILVTVQNKENVTYDNLRLDLVIGQGGRGGRDARNTNPLGGVNIPSIQSNQSLSYTVNYVGTAGQFIISASIIYQNVQLPNSTDTVNIEVFQPKAGNNSSLLIAITTLLAAILAIICLQPVFDKIKY